MKNEMKKTNSYMTRALQSRDPRYAKILGKLGYDRRDMVAGGNLDKQIKNNKAKQAKVSVDNQIENFHKQREEQQSDETVQQEFDQAIPANLSVDDQSLNDLDLVALRLRYKEVLGKQPYHGWDEDKLRQLIKEAKE